MQETIQNIILRIPLIIGFVIWIFFAVYFFIDMRKKIRLAAEKNGVMVVFECKHCNRQRKYPYSEYMEIVKHPRKKIQSLSSTQNQYLFNCETCGEKHYQQLLYEEIPENSNFTKERRKIILLFILKEYLLGILIIATMGLSGILPK